MQQQFSPGYRFYPTDQELLTCFLDKKINKQPIPPNKAVQDFDIYTQDPWDIWRTFDGDYLGDKIDQDQGLFFLTELKKVSDKKQGSNFARSVPSGRWHGDTAGEPITDSRGSTIGFKKYFIYRNKKSTANGHDGKWKMHEITSLIHPSSNYVLCQLQKNDKGKRKNCGLETETGASFSCDDDVHVQKRRKLISDTNQHGEAELSGFCEPEDNTVCATAGADFENPIGSSTAITYLTDEGVSLEELMNILDEETDSSALLETDPKHIIEDSKATESWWTDITETEVHTWHPSSAVDVGSNHVDALDMDTGVAEACLPVRICDSNGDFFTDMEQFLAPDPQFASPFLLPCSDNMLPAFHNASWPAF